LFIPFSGLSHTHCNQGIVYVWSRKSEHIQMNFLGLFVFQAPFLPLVILGVGTLLGQSPIHDILGLLAGHIYWFFADVYPQIRPGRELLGTPMFLRALFDAPAPAPVPPPIHADAVHHDDEPGEFDDEKVVGHEKNVEEVAEK
jgi:hypothetical protein